MATGPSFFRDIKNCIFTPNGGSAQNIYGIKSISRSTRLVQVKCGDNDHLRPVSFSTVGIDETVTVNTEDMAALDALDAVSGPGTLKFLGIAVDHNAISLSQQGDTEHTITNVVFDSNTRVNPSKATASGSISGWTMEDSAGDDENDVPLASSSSSGALN